MEDDVCYECTGYGDDYYIDENGYLVSKCPDCVFNSWSASAEMCIDEGARHDGNEL